MSSEMSLGTGSSGVSSDVDRIPALRQLKLSANCVCRLAHLLAVCLEATATGSRHAHSYSHSLIISIAPTLLFRQYLLTSTRLLACLKLERPEAERCRDYVERMHSVV